MDEVDITVLHKKFVKMLMENHPDEVLDAMASALAEVAGDLNVRGSKGDIFDAVEALQRASGTYEDYHDNDDDEDDEDTSDCFDDD